MTKNIKFLYLLDLALELFLSMKRIIRTIIIKKVNLSIRIVDCRRIWDFTWSVSDSDKFSGSVNTTTPLYSTFKNNM